MSVFAGPVYAAAPGSSGNTTHASVRPMPNVNKVAFVLVVEAAGATPQISWKVQGSLDRDQVADASANWVDLGLVTPASDSPAAIPIVVNPAPAGTSSVAWLSGGGGGPNKAPPRLVRRVRVVTSANTNVSSYRVEMTEQT
jgi:hypothetical protein